MIDPIINTSKPDMSQLPGGWEVNPTIVFNEFSKSNREDLKISDNSSAFLIHDLISQTDCEKLIRIMNDSPRFESVSVQGRKDIVDERVGSKRTTIWSNSIAEALWAKLQPFFGIREMNNLTSTDWWQGNKDRRIWEPVGITPMLRFMRYTNGGQHYAHYDAGFIYNDDNYRTLQSFVLYLTTNLSSGATRFIHDNQDDVQVWRRIHDDWVRPVKNEEVIYNSFPHAGTVLVFDHRLCHDVQFYEGEGPRIIIRGDVLFKAK